MRQCFISSYSLSLFPLSVWFLWLHVDTLKNDYILLLQVNCFFKYACIGRISFCNCQRRLDTSGEHPELYVAWSTKRLLQCLPDSMTIMLHADDTSNTNWYGFPVLMLTCSDVTNGTLVLITALVSDSGLFVVTFRLSACVWLGRAYVNTAHQNKSRYCAIMHDLCSMCIYVYVLQCSNKSKTAYKFLFEAFKKHRPDVNAKWCMADGATQIFRAFQVSQTWYDMQCICS